MNNSRLLLSTGRTGLTPSPPAVSKLGLLRWREAQRAQEPAVKLNVAVHKTVIFICLYPDTRHRGCRWARLSVEMCTGLFQVQPRAFSCLVLMLFYEGCCFLASAAARVLSSQFSVTLGRLFSSWLGPVLLELLLYIPGSLLQCLAASMLSKCWWKERMEQRRESPWEDGGDDFQAVRFRSTVPMLIKKQIGEMYLQIHWPSLPCLPFVPSCHIQALDIGR